tara:strand:+ start:505 stop:1575 length:1071 start_codon:yes stop_codon:yes gene_type:complete
MIENCSSKKILITGGSGFIGSALIRKLLLTTNYKIINIDKISSQSSPESIESIFKSSNIHLKNRYKFIKVDLRDTEILSNILKEIDPEMIFHLAAESHVDRSIANPKEFFKNNVVGTLNLLNESLNHFEKLSEERKKNFILINVSTDEVFGSLKNDDEKFNEKSKYKPNSPYSASKASSDFIVRAWHKTYAIPIITTNCSNNYGPWQHPEKLIPSTILRALTNSSIPIYGNGKNIRDWLFVEDHVDALLKISSFGKIGESYCIGGSCEINNINIVELICNLLDKKIKPDKSFKNLISFVEDRPGHDYRYAIDSTKMLKEFNWMPKYNFEKALGITVDWYLENKDWLFKKDLLKEKN